MEEIVKEILESMHYALRLSLLRYVQEDPEKLKDIISKLILPDGGMKG